jgi:hypothetical protein
MTNFFITHPANGEKNIVALTGALRHPFAVAKNLIQVALSSGYPSEFSHKY